MGQGHCHDYGSGHHHGGGCCCEQGLHHGALGRGHHEIGFGSAPGYHFENRREMLERLEEYQKDLEQRVADVADLIRHLTDTEQEQSATV
jgi:hypothetical protein